MRRCKKKKRRAKHFATPCDYAKVSSKELNKSSVKLIKYKEAALAWDVDLFVISILS